MKLRLHRWSERTLISFCVVAGAALILIIVLIVFFMVAQRGREIMKVANEDQVIRVIYHPGGLGTSNRLEVVAENARNESQQLVWAIGGDSASVRFLSRSEVEIITLAKLYRTPTDWYWRTLDSTVFNLSRENTTRMVGDPGAG